MDFEKVLSRHPIHTSRSFTIWESEIQLGNTCVIWEQISLKGVFESVMALPITHDKKIIFIKKFCPATQTEELVLPGGKIDKGETPETTVHKELSQEIGLKSNKLISIGPLKILPAYLIATTHGFIATDLTSQLSADKDEKEKLIPFPFTLSEALTRIKRNIIQDSRTVAFVLTASTFYGNHFH